MWIGSPIHTLCYTSCYSTSSQGRSVTYSNVHTHFSVGSTLITFILKYHMFVDANK